jgi:predicted phosphohydrolase
MALYAIGDLHLSIGSDKPMDVFGSGWEGYVERIQEGFKSLEPDDVCVLCGDLSWAQTLEAGVGDFRFISRLPGKKIILKGNHDYWWYTQAKMKAFFAENGFNGLDILHCNCYYYNGMAICGSRGWTVDSKTDEAHNAKITRREAIRLDMSLRSADGAREKLCFLHYPPLYHKSRSDEIIDVMRSHGVKRCWYGHIHGLGHNYAFQGTMDGIEYSMVSADYLKFAPLRIYD